MANMVLTMCKALLKHKLHLGELTGMERFMVSAVTLADRASTFLAATNVEPELIDPRFDYVLLSQSVEANLELFGLVRERAQLASFGEFGAKFVKAINDAQDSGEAPRQLTRQVLEYLRGLMLVKWA